MNNKSLLLVLVVCGLILSALVFRNGKLLSLTLPFLVYLIIGIIQAPGEMKLIARRTNDNSSVIAGNFIETRLVIENRGSALINLYLKDSLASSLEIVEGSAHQRLSLSAGETTELKYTLSAARGIYSWKMVSACASDPFGLFDLESDVPAPGEVLVRPAALQIRSTTLKPRFTLQQTTGPISARSAGSGTDFWGIREYKAGDPVQRLNWRLAARHPHKLFTNEYEREEISDFGFILDTRKLTNSDGMEEALFEYSVSAVASLSKNILKQGNRVSLLVFGEFISSVFPGYGMGQLSVLQRKLACAKLGGNLPFNYLEYFPTRLFPSRSMIIILSTVDSRDLETYARLLAFGYEVLLISPDPTDFASRMSPSTEINRLASRAARVERVLLLKQLLKVGVNVIDWQVNQSLEIILHKTTKQLIRKENVQVRV